MTMLTYLLTWVLNIPFMDAWLPKIWADSNKTVSIELYLGPLAIICSKIKRATIESLDLRLDEICLELFFDRLEQVNVIAKGGARELNRCEDYVSFALREGDSVAVICFEPEYRDTGSGHGGYLFSVMSDGEGNLYVHRRHLKESEATQLGGCGCPGCHAN